MDVIFVRNWLKKTAKFLGGKSANSSYQDARTFFAKRFYFAKEFLNALRTIVFIRCIAFANETNIVNKEIIIYSLWYHLKKLSPPSFSLSLLITSLCFLRYIQTRLNYGPVSTMLLLFISAREMVDADFQDHIPLLGPQTSHTRYTTEEGLEEVKVEEGAPVKCFPCRDCVIL